MVRLPGFLEYVMSQWHEYIESLSRQIERSFVDYDAYLKRNAINFEQFHQILVVDLRISLQGCLGNQEDSGRLEQIFIDAVLTIEKNKVF